MKLKETEKVGYGDTHTRHLSTQVENVANSRPAWPQNESLFPKPNANKTTKLNGPAVSNSQLALFRKEGGTNLMC